MDQLRAYTFPVLPGQTGGDGTPITLDTIKDAVWTWTFAYESPYVYKFSDRQGNPMTVIAYPNSMQPGQISGWHEIWTPRDYLAAAVAL